MTNTTNVRLIKFLTNTNLVKNFIVRGSSMLPYIQQGEKAIISPDSSIEKGSVLFFNYDNYVLLHRVVRVKKDKYICKGDNNFRLETVCLDDTIGVCTEVIDINGSVRQLKTVSSLFTWMSYRIGLICLKKKNSYNRVRKTFIFRVFKFLYFRDV